MIRRKMLRGDPDVAEPPEYHAYVYTYVSDLMEDVAEPSDASDGS